MSLTYREALLCYQNAMIAFAKKAVNSELKSYTFFSPFSVDLTSLLMLPHTHSHSLSLTHSLPHSLPFFFPSSLLLTLPYVTSSLSLPPSLSLIHIYLTHSDFLSPTHPPTLSFLSFLYCSRWEGYRLCT